MCDHCSCRQFAPIADLSLEHEVILEHAWQLAEGKDETGVHARTLLDILDDHVRKEELGLYPWLARVDALDAAVIDRLEDEHVSVRAEILEGRFDRRAFFALAAHIEEEEMELFPAAMFAFDDDAWDMLEGLIEPAA